MRVEINELLKDLYKFNNISVPSTGEIFKCASQVKCYINNESPKCCRGSEAYVGSNYNKNKILVVSMDRGEKAKNLNDRKEEIRDCIKNCNNYINDKPYTKERPYGYPLNPHMTGLLRTLISISYPDQNSSNINEIFNSAELLNNFAMINAAKCCLGQGMKSAPIEYFDNCFEYALEEIKILRPCIIIGQGRIVAEKLRAALDEISKNNNSLKLIICAYHPSAYIYKSRFNKFLVKLPKLINRNIQYTDKDNENGIFWSWSSG